MNIIKEVVKHRLTFGGVQAPTIEAPYGLYDNKGLRVSQPGVVCSYDYETKIFAPSIGAELCAPALLEDFKQHRDVLKLFKNRLWTEKWQSEEVLTGYPGPFAYNQELARKKLLEFNELDKATKSEIRFYASVLKVGLAFLKMSRECEVIHTVHLPSKIFQVGPVFHHPVSVDEGGAFFVMDNKLPVSIITRLGYFNFSSLVSLNKPENLNELRKRFNIEMQVMDITADISYSHLYPFMGNGAVQIRHTLDKEEHSKAEKNRQRWNEIREFVYLLQKSV